MSYAAKILADSVNTKTGDRLTTFEVTYPRFVHAELMTHRLFCLAGDSVLEFDMPAGQKSGRRVYKMTLQDFVGKWLHGAQPHRSRWDTERTYDMKPRLREMRIRQLNEATGDIEFSTVVNAMESGLKPVYEVRAGKHVVAGSKDHRVMTNDGWKTIGELDVGDELVVRTQLKPEELKSDPLRLKKIDGRWRSVWQREQREKLIAVVKHCQACCRRPGEEIHHVVPVWQDQSRAFDETNIVLLCNDCHAQQHEKQGWQTGNPLCAGLAVVDSIRYRGTEPTYDLEIAGPFPNFLANGVVVHNSRNSASSRAVPIEKMIQRVIDDPAGPVFWGKNQKGMQAAEELTGIVRVNAETNWLAARDEAVVKAQAMAAIGVHKQIVNRLLEPWMWITVIVSATEYENFFALRCHKDAQPEIQRIAYMMRALYEESRPCPMGVGGWHAPLLFVEDSEVRLDVRLKLSAARCARVSYLTHDGRRDPQADLDLFDRLVTSGHWSPLEHVAQAMDEGKRFGNLGGWRQLRKTFVGEHRGRDLETP